ncbi:MAG: biopolymer transporter ExbD [Gemmatimonadetes bacterium]|nr:biopolymer transporter ExbD [Gemmatimonadota bacterium]
MTDHDASPNVTPFLDILLVLLIIFMVAVQKRVTLDVQLPDPAARGGPDAVPIVLEVTPGPRYAINREPVPPASLRARLAALYAPRRDKQLLVRGARDVSYQDVMTAMDIAKGAGVRVLGVDPSPPRP